MSSNAFAVQPELVTPFPSGRTEWVCPHTGLIVPKNPVKNLEWRAKLFEAAEDDKGLQQDLYTASAKSLLFWVNTFGMTFRIMDTDRAGKKRQVAEGNIPMITWDIQDLHLLEIEKAINDGYDLLTDKTRDMGSTWDHLFVFHHQWLFKEERLFLEMSRVESDVDGADNPRALMVKHDYINRWLPSWMLPQINRTRLHIVNEDNGSRIDGESSNKAAGSSDRRHALLLDEFAKMENADKIKAATADVSPCRLPNSTPWGAGTAYSRWRMSGQIKVFVLPWYEHPEKGRGRYTKQDDTTGKWKIRSPWYDAEAETRTQKEMAQEIDMDHIGSGDTYFEAHVLEEHRRLFKMKPLSNRIIDFKKGVASDAIPKALAHKHMAMLATKGSNGPFKIYTRLVHKRFDQTKNYVMGIDISQGQGASNSVISVICKETREKVAEWVDANTPPHDFARIACALALWIGGRDHGHLPLMIWEANGPGWVFGREVVRKYKYPHFYRDKIAGTPTEKETKRYGWQSSREKKELMLGHYRQALAHGGVVNHSEEALEEALQYIYYADGGIGPAALIEESSSARLTHGDRVIADGLALWGLGGTPSSSVADGPAVPPNSPAGRKKQWDAKRRQSKKAESFDFRKGA